MVPSSLPGVERLGLLRDPERPDALFAIAIREDRERQRWYAGDGQKELRPDLAPDGADAVLRRP